MDILLHSLAMLALVSATGFAARRLPNVPLPLLQIAVGALVALPPGGLHVMLDPDVFMGLFIPPLLFVGAQQMPQRELGLLKTPILLLAIGLVAVTVLAVGAAAHALLPFLSWPCCFLLAALLSPTDAVAFGALIAGRQLPDRMLRILEGESLVNDATGLVAVKLSVAALSTTFSPWRAGGEFLAMAGGGLLVGAASSWLLQSLQQKLTARQATESSLPGVLLQLLAPFPPYLIAEHLGFSGVLATVAAGLVASGMHARVQALSASRMHAQSTLRLVGFVLDGMVFLLLGMQLPALVRLAPMPAHATRVDAGHTLVLCAIAAAIALALLVVRFAWIAGLGCVARRRAQPAGAPVRPLAESLKLSLVGALAGVRGAVSLAAALGLPYLLPGGESLPARELMIFLCAGAIVTSLVAPTVLLPALLRRPGGEAGVPAAREERWARRRALRAGLTCLEHTAHTFLRSPCPSMERVTEEYRQRLRQSHAVLAARTGEEPLAREIRLHLLALAAERRELVRLRLSHRINDVTFQSLSARVDFDEIYLRRRPPHIPA